ncbi:MAG: ATP-binding protein [Mycobacterium sp.]
MADIASDHSASYDTTSYDTANYKNGKRHRARSVRLQVAAILENLAVLRTLVAAIGTFEDLDLDAVADLRLAVDEACTRLIRSAVPNATLLLVVDPQAEALVVRASTMCDGGGDILPPGSFSWHVLTSLTDELSTFSSSSPASDGQQCGISMTTRRASSLR